MQAIMQATRHHAGHHAGHPPSCRPSCRPPAIMQAIMQATSQGEHYSTRGGRAAGGAVVSTVYSRATPGGWPASRGMPTTGHPWRVACFARDAHYRPPLAGGLLRAGCPLQATPCRWPASRGMPTTGHPLPVACLFAVAAVGHSFPFIPALSPAPSGIVRSSSIVKIETIFTEGHLLNDTCTLL